MCNKTNNFAEISYTNTKEVHMAKNNGKFTFFLILCILVVAVILIMGVSEKNKISKVSSFGISNNNYANKIACASSELSKTNNNANKSLKQENSIELLCLMYHNVVADNQKQGSYEIRVSALEKDFVELKKMGYQCVDRKNLLSITDKKRYGKYVMITFDDGFYGVYKYVPKLLEKHNMSCIVSVVGEFMDIADKQNFKSRCSYMNTKEVKELAKNQRIEVAHHSYNMHHFGKDRQGVKIRQDENAEEYTNKLMDDTKNLNNKLRSIGINARTYCYPFGAYCKESERLFKELNYQMTMTCNEKINYIKDRNSLYLIGRINRSANYENISNMLLKTCNKK